MQAELTPNAPSGYRGRIAPTPTGLLHLGHAKTFMTAFRRARKVGGSLVMRIEDLDPLRSQQAYADAALEDLAWLGIAWDEGPDCGGPHAPYVQSKRTCLYARSWARLRDAGYIYPTRKSRKDVREATRAPHDDETSEAVFPTALRPPPGTGKDFAQPGDWNWRFRVPDGLRVSFDDERCGPQNFEAGRDFGDFVVWRRDGVPAYELAVVVDDIAMEISEVVRGEDLLLSTARQLLLFEALGSPTPAFYHCELVRDATGQRLAKRHASMALRHFKEQGTPPDELALT